MSPRWLVWAPLALFVLLAIAFVFGLRKPDDQTIASKMIGAPVPAFALPAAMPALPGLTSSDLATGTPHLVNIFASWCIPCGVEAPQLAALARAGVPIVGIAIRDTPADLADFLRRNGNPFQRIGGDADSRVQMALGSSGVPESFVVDGKGVIRLQHIGDIRAENVPAILAAIEAAR